MEIKLINNIVLSGFLAGTLLMNLPLNGQTPKGEELKNLKEEIRLRADKIRKTVKTFNIIKTVAPIVVGVAGVALTAVAAAVIFGLFRLPFNRLKKGLTEIEEVIAGSSSYGSKQIMWKNIKKYFLFFPTFKNWAKRRSLKKTTAIGHLKSEKFATAIKEYIVNKKLEKKTKLIAKIGAPIGFIVMAFAGIIGTAAATLGAYFIPAALASAYDGAKKLKELEKQYPGILTSQQNKLLKKFETLSQDLTVQAGIKGMKIREAKKSIINAAIQQHPALVATLGGQPEARKLFSKYVGLKWKKNIFQKLAGTAAGIIAKLPLKNITSKIKKLEMQHPLLKIALESSAQDYTTQVNALLEELKNQIIEAAEKGKLKPGEIPQPIIAL